MNSKKPAIDGQLLSASQLPASAFPQAPVSGSKKPAIDGQLIILAAGDESLFADATPALSKMGKRWMHLGATGAGARMKLVVNMIMGSMMGEKGKGVRAGLFGVGSGQAQATRGNVCWGTRGAGNQHGYGQA